MNKQIDIVISFTNMLQKIADLTANTDYMETYNTVTKVLDGEIDPGSIYNVAFEIHDCDLDKPILPDVKDFLMTVYQLGIDEGNALCMNNMGCLYYLERCGMRDYKKAAHYYEMAVKAGCALSAENIGYIYYYGFDTEVNYELAYKYFSMAALQGFVEATYKVGDMFRYGYYVDKSETAAYALYREAYEKCIHSDDCKVGGNVFKRMGDAFYEGIGTIPNPMTALIFYQRAEQLFYDQIMAGDPFAGKDLDYVIKVQPKIRKMIAKQLPKML